MTKQKLMGSMGMKAKCVEHLRGTGNANLKLHYEPGSLTEHQVVLMQKFIDMGDEMRSLVAQTHRLLDNIGAFKAKPRPRSEKFVCNPDSKKIYDLLFKISWTNIFLYKSAGLSVWSCLDSAMCEVTRVNCSREEGPIHNGTFLSILSHSYDEWPELQTPTAGLDEKDKMTEGDLGMIIAFARRYKAWVGEAKSMAMSTELRTRMKAVAARFVRDIDRVEQQAMSQLTVLLEDHGSWTTT